MAWQLAICSWLIAFAIFLGGGGRANAADISVNVVVGHYVDIPAGSDTWSLDPTHAANFYRVGPDYDYAVPWTGTYFNTSDGTFRDNEIRPTESLRVGAGAATVGTVLTFTATSASSGPFTFHVTVTNSLAQISALNRLDPVSTASGLVRWEAVFSAPVTGVTTANFAFANPGVLYPAPALVSAVPSAGWNNVRWTVTAQIAGYGRGTLGLNYIGYAGETPAVWNTVTGDTYSVDTLTFGMAPGGQVAVGCPGTWTFTIGPSPATATMSRASSDLISVFPWGDSNFQADPSNERNRIYAGEYLLVDASYVPSGGQVSVPIGGSIGSNSGPLRVNVLAPPAQVVSMNIIDPSPTVASTVHWEVTFDKAVASVSTASFGFINSANIQPPPSVISAVPTPGAGNVKWIVTAGTPGQGIGLLSLRWSGHQTESPSVPYPFIGQTYDFSFYPVIVQDVQTTAYYVAPGAPQPTLSVLFNNRASQTIYYQWKLGTSQNPSSATDISGAYNPTYTPPVSSVQKQIQYFCRAYTDSETGYYTDSSTATVIVVAPATITAQPTASTLITAGSTATLSIQVGGYNPQIQWYQGQPGDTSAPVAGATAATFTTPAISAKTTYWAQVGNVLGAAYNQNSQAATISVVKTLRFAQNNPTTTVDSTLSGYGAVALDELGQGYNNLPLTFTLSAAGVVGGTTPGGSFSGVTYVPGTIVVTANTDKNGNAIMPDLWTNTMAGSYTVKLSYGGLNTNLTITNVAGPLNNVTLTSSPPTTLVAGTLFGFSLQSYDAWSNIILTNGVPATAAVGNGTGTLLGTTTVNSVAGAYTFTNLSYTKAETMRWQVNFGPGSSYLGTVIKVTAAAPALITTNAGDGQVQPPGTAFPTMLRVLVTDAYGNIVTGKAVTFTVPAVGATASLSQTTVNTDSRGTARTTATAGAIPGAYLVTANLSPALTPAAVFSLANMTALQAWRAANFGGQFDNNGAAADLANPYGDGVPNLEKYTFNLNPRTADDTTMTANGTKGLPLLGLDSSGRLTLTYVRRKAATLPAITYQPQFSNTAAAGDFAVNNSATTSTPVSIDGTWEWVTVTDSVINPPGGRRFGRVLLSDP